MPTASDTTDGVATRPVAERITLDAHARGEHDDVLIVGCEACDVEARREAPRAPLALMFAERIVNNVRRYGYRFVCVDDVQEVYQGGRLIDQAAHEAIRQELREYGVYA